MKPMPTTLANYNWCDHKIIAVVADRADIADRAWRRHAARYPFARPDDQTAEAINSIESVVSFDTRAALVTYLLTLTPEILGRLVGIIKAGRHDMPMREALSLPPIDVTNAACEEIADEPGLARRLGVGIELYRYHAYSRRAPR